MQGHGEVNEDKEEAAGVSGRAVGQGRLREAVLLCCLREVLMGQVDKGGTH